MTAEKIYLASRYSRKEEMRHYAFVLESCGRRVTSSWLKESYSPNVSMTEIPENENRSIAITDLEDIDRADAMIFFSEDQNKQPPRGGRHVEFGYALAKGKAIYVIGEKENIFHHLPQIAVYPAWEHFMLGECFG